MGDKQEAETKAIEAAVEEARQVLRKMTETVKDKSKEIAERAA